MELDFALINHQQQKNCKRRHEGKMGRPNNPKQLKETIINQLHDLSAQNDYEMICTNRKPKIVARSY